MLKNQTTFLLLSLGFVSSAVFAQEITIFEVADFDLNGKVKSCLISTDYGKEEYQFDASGRLVEAVTRYNEEDYDLTVYKYGNYELLEKRVESYREKILDKAISIAHLYTYDSTKNRNITEKVITYEKEFLEQYQYSYTADKKLSKVVRTNNTGIDETTVVYFNDDNSASANYILNREMQQSVKTSIKKVSDSTQIKTITTKKFLEGKPNTAIEEIFKNSEKLLSKIEFSYDADAKKFISKKSTSNTYNPDGTLLKTEVKLGDELSTKDFIYQYDSNGNWIKQIVTPDNSYKTRKISYYETK